MIASLLLLLLLPFPLQEDPEAAYRQDYAKYTDITNIADAAEKTEAYMAFLEEGFDDRLFDFVIGGMQEALQELTAAGRYADVYPLADQWLSQRAEDLQPVVLALQAAVGEMNAEQTIKWGEMFYGTQPDPQIALILAQNYLQLENAAKIREYGQIALDNFPIDQTWAFAYEILGQDDAANRLAQAATMAKKLQGELRQAPEGVSAAQWGEIRLYLQDVVARDSFEGGRHQEAIQNYNTLNEMSGGRSDKAWYFIGRSLLELDQIANAMNSFANAYVLDGAYAQNAYQNLETIYRANTGGQTEGMDRYINEARQRMANR